MSYFLCAIISVSIFFYIEINQGKNVLYKNKIYINNNINKIILFILLVYWTLLIGLQYETGTDYNSYKRIFLGDNQTYLRKGEYLFYYISLFIYNNNIHYQFGFIFIAFIQFFCLIIFINKIKLDKYHIFIFLYFFVCTSFYNQTNVIRQYVAIYLFLLASWYMYKKNIFFYLILVIIASLFHISALMLLPFYFIFKIKFSKIMLLLILLISIIISFMNINKFLSLFLQYIPSFKQYAEYEYAFKNISLLNKLTKYIFIPFYILSLSTYEKLNKKDKYFFKIGFISYSIKIFCLISPIFNRFGQFFEILAIFPLYYYFKNINRYKKLIEQSKIIIFIFILITISMLIGKTIILPSYEYNYKSIINQYIF